ncbi:surface-adhesin E family protein [Aggregatibacter kilianii]|uniref:surface-adhesin E family protein n=1 Tax=Aggregatibacter kilianii TaxID=2025884 RepID=UPI000D655C89|nr:surface-adhesin E family protein [Aggregatibacter kilianii]
MKKTIVILTALLLAACTNFHSTHTSAKNAATAQQDEVPITPPKDTKTGFLQLVPGIFYYVDMDSVWVDNQDKRLIYFDAVINLDKGLYVFKEYPTLFAKSIRQYKILNCENFHFTHVRSDFYADFWGDGIRTAPKRQSQHTITLQPQSSLYILGQVMCANMYRRK